MTDRDILAEAREAFEQASEAENDNRLAFVDDKRFARLGRQWPEKIEQDRQREGRPCLTINRMPSFTRQVVNDARQNKPSIKVHPADSKADPATADVYNGLIRNIEYASSADVAYDTGIENAVDGGFGYWRIGLDYTHDDAFDLDITIKRVADPLLVYGDPLSTEADSSDWNSAFVVERMPTAAFERQYKGAEKVDWKDDYGPLGEPWYQDDTVMVAEWWTREEVERTILLMSDGQVLDEARLAECKDYLDALGVRVMRSRKAKTFKVTQRILTGAEELEMNDWPGRFIPIVPVYGDEVWVDGKRHLRSLIRDAKDPQRMFNFWRTTTTELVALSPKAPFIGPKGAFKSDAAKWATINTQSHAYVEYDAVANGAAPQRQPFAGVPAGALQEALNASDDMKAIMGLYDASLGARSNETSGRAIMARQREGDVSTFHFIDNLARAIRHTGRIVIDLIPHVYSKERIVRVLGEDGTPSQVPLGTPVPVTDPDGKPVVDATTGQVKTRIYDLGAGKYDLTVSSGPSFTSRREEAAVQMTELIRAFPAAAPVIGPILAKNLDWPGADEIARRLDQVWQASQGKQGEDQGLPQELQQGIAKLQETIGRLQAENQALKADRSVDMAKLQVQGFEADTDRMRAVHEVTRPGEVREALA
jgi:hypothetical protein